MSKNTFKIYPNQRSNNGESVFSVIERMFNLSTFFENGMPIKYLPNALFILLIGVFYIGNIHYTEKTTRKINSIQMEVESLKADYSSLKADYMHAMLQSEVAKRVKDLGLQESSTPQKKILIKQGEY